MANFATLKREIPIEDGIALLNLRNMVPVDQKDPNKAPQWRGKCPVCPNSTDRDLVITQGKGFMCWAGKAVNGRKPSGSIVDLVAHIRGLAVKPAGEWIEAEQKRRNDTKESRNSRDDTGNGSQSSAATVAGFRNSAEPRVLQPLTYLKATHEAVQALGIDPETAEHFGAGYSPLGVHQRGRLAIPIYDRAGQLVAYVGRSVKEELPMLTFPKNFDMHSFLFNWERQVEGDTVYIVEDPLQVFLAYQNGVENVVSTLTDMTPDVVHMIGNWMDEAEIVYIRPM